MPGVEERGVELAVERAPRVGVADVELRQVEDERIVEMRADRGADPAAAAGDESLHGRRTTLPTLPRDSSSACAFSTSASGNSAPTSGLIFPAPQSSSSSRMRRGDDVGRVAHEPAEVDALDADVAPDEVRRLHLGPHPGREADRDELAERLEPRDRRLEQVAADRVDDDVDAQVLGDLVVEIRLGGAELAAEVELLRRAGRRDDLRAERPRDLDRRRADAAGGGVDEHRRAVAQHDLPRERDVRGEEGEQERRALGERRVLGQRHERALVDRRELGVTAGAGRAP